MNAVSYSLLNTYQRCPLMARYRFGMVIQPKKRKTALFKGIAAHEMWKELFLGMQDGQAIEDAWEQRVLPAAEQAVLEARKYTFDNELLDAEKEIDTLVMIIRRYIDQYNQRWTPLHVEETFYITLEGGATLSFTPDLVVEDENGYVWVVDHKTTSRLPTDGVPFGDTQALLYYSGVKSLYPNTKGFIFNRARKKLPTVPRLTKTGKKRVASLDRIDTTYEVLRDFIKEEAPDLLSDPAHKRRLAELRDGPDRFFWTDTVYVSEAEEAAILEDVSYVYSQVMRSAETDKWPRALREDNGYMSCSKCAYAILCKTEMLGQDTDYVLEEYYEKADPKNPYEGEVE